LRNIAPPRPGSAGVMSGDVIVVGPPAVMDSRGPDAEVPARGLSPSPEPAEGPESIPVIIVDDEDLFRDLVSTVLSESGKVTVLGAYPDAEAALEAARRLRPKVVVLDIELEGPLNGIQAGLLLRKEFPDIGIVWLSAYKRPYLPVSFQQQATSGWAYLLKQSGTDTRALLAAIDAVSKGFVVLDSQISDSMNRLLNTWIPPLTPSQYDVLALMAQGFGNAAVVKGLGLPEKSVERILNQIYHHLRLNRRDGAKHRRVEAVVKYLRAGQTPTGMATAGKAR
jgi:DNA-binding NarL/FixJ family response regulator